jgi:2-oxo-4-hydroxy-4-carboxy-5-ureidoimidazoline decarboxylase
MNEVLMLWNERPADAAALVVLPSCGSSTWARQLTARRPFESESALIAASDEIWNQLAVEDKLEAFSKHPRIGERKAPDGASPQSAAWSTQEQREAASAGEAMQSALAGANREYEQKFGRVFLVCATGKPAGKILDILRQRLQNDDETEFQVAAEEQRKITNLRLKKWLQT